MTKKRFRPLGPDEPIGVVALSGPIQKERLDRGLEQLTSWGREIILAPNLESRQEYLAGDDDERRAGLEAVLDQGARVILAARGGYGVTRLLDDLPWSRMIDDELMCIGFSDFTALINRLAVHGHPQIHGPMAAAGLERPNNARRLLEVVTGDLQGRPLFSFPQSSVVRHGCVSGPIYGFNLSMLTALVGGRFEVDLQGSILLLEDVSEPLYRLDRMLTQLRHSARLNGVKALMCGALHCCRPARTRDEIWPRLIMDALPKETVVVTDLPFGHGAVNMAFPVGVRVEVDSKRGVMTWL